MPSWSRFWHQLTHRRVRRAWGLAADGQDWALVGLSSHNLLGVQVQVLEKIIPTGSDRTIDGFGDGLRRVGVRWRDRVSVALAEDEVMAGVLELPAQLPRDDWSSEVQLEVAQVLGLAPDQVNFDFQADPVSEGLLTRVHWVGCEQSRIRALRHAVRAAGGQLESVEPAWHAAHRAASHLKGGLESLITQAPQDWQFDLAVDHEQDQDQRQPSGGAHGELDRVLTQALQSPAGPRLVASGLALKAWLR
jgi:hypothetical protein